jgi:hypothetical protein
MMKTSTRRTHKLSLSFQTLRKLTTPELARAQGGLYVTVSYCVDVGDDTVVRHTDDGCAGNSQHVTACCPIG